MVRASYSAGCQCRTRKDSTGLSFAPPVRYGNQLVRQRAPGSAAAGAGAGERTAGASVSGAALVSVTWLESTCARASGAAARHHTRPAAPMSVGRVTRSDISSLQAMGPGFEAAGIYGPPGRKSTGAAAGRPSYIATAGHDVAPASSAGVIRLGARMTRLVFWDVDTLYDFMHADGQLYVPRSEEIIPRSRR